MNTNQLRQQQRQLRNTVSARDCAVASAQVCQQLQQLPEILFSSHIGIYDAAPHEIDPHAFVRILWQRQRAVYFPVLHPCKHNRLWFARCEPDTPLIANPYGILEPSRQQAQLLPVNLLNVVLVPLVAFDRRGHRIGMGKGYYDRTLAYCRHQILRPLLVGLAYSFQEISSGIEAQAWDVPLDWVITEKEVIYCRR